MAMMLSPTTNTMPPKLNTSGGGRAGYVETDDVTKTDLANGINDQSCTLCWSSTLSNPRNNNGEGYYDTSVKTRSIRLRKISDKQSLGFSIRGGWEHGIGFFVSDVQPDSIAAKQGLCVSEFAIFYDQISVND